MTRALMPFAVFSVMLAVEYGVRWLCRVTFDPTGATARAFMAAPWFWIGSFFFGSAR